MQNKTTTTNIKKNIPKKKMKKLTKDINNLSLKNSKMQRYSKLSRRQLLNKYQSFQMSYARSIVLPEYAREAKIPSIFPQPTASIHKHLTIPFNVSTNGKAVIAWQPYFLQNSTSNYSSLYINNSTTLTLTSPEVTTGYTPINTQFGIPVDTFSNYRLVSAACRIDPQMSLQTASGSIAGGIAVYANQYGSHPIGTNVFLFAGDLTLSSNIDNLLYFNKSNITAQQSMRHIYFPLDPSFEMYTPIGYPHGQDSSVGSANTDFYFVYYITGAPANSSFNLELYLNFECIPTPYAEGYISMAPYSGNEDSSKIIKSVTTKPELITQSANNMNNVLQMEEHDFNNISSENSLYTFAKSAGSFLLDHSADIGSFLGGILL